MLTHVNSFLRCEGPFSVRRDAVPWPLLGLFLVVGGFIYGAVMGMYNARALQALYSGTKVPFLLVVSSVICLPSFFVVNTILGLREDFAAAVRGIVAAQATLAVTLVALAPFTVFFYATTHDYDFSIVMNGVMFFIGAVTGQVTLSRHYRALIEKNPLHRFGRVSWLVIYIFVAIQMGWVLRPFLGSPSMATTFFRKDAWSNAYVEVIGRVWAVLSGQ